MRSHVQGGGAGAVRAFIAALVLTTFATGTVAAADPPAAPSAEPAPSPARAAAKPLLPPPRLKEGTLVLFNRPIVTFRASFIGNSPTQRAANARERISGLLAHDGAGKVTIEE